MIEMTEREETRMREVSISIFKALVTEASVNGDGKIFGDWEGLRSLARKSIQAGCAYNLEWHRTFEHCPDCVHNDDEANH